MGDICIDARKWPTNSKNIYKTAQIAAMSLVYSTHIWRLRTEYTVQYNYIQLILFKVAISLEHTVPYTITYMYSIVFSDIRQYISLKKF